MNGWILTGSIGSGKSTTASLLKLYGYKVISADEVAKKVREENRDKIVEMFGTADKGELAKIIFNDSKKREELEKLLHPKIKSYIMEEAYKLEKDEVPYFLVIPLYFEKGNYPEFDKVVVVYTPIDIEIERVAKRNGISIEEAKKLVNLQMNIDEKRKRATYVIDNSKDLKHLQKEVEKFISYLKN